MNSKKILNIFSVCLVFFVWATVCAQTADNVSDIHGMQYRPWQLIVKFKEHKINLEQPRGMQVLSQMADRQNFDTEKSLPQQNIALITIDGSQTVQDEMLRLSLDPNVEYVQPNFVYHILMSAPNDTHFDDQRWLNNAGQVVDGQTGTVGADIGRLAAMDIRSGDGNQSTTGTTVAVLDVGVQYNHPDLINQMRDGTNCLSVTWATRWWCIGGFNGLLWTKTPTIGEHGSHVAGIIGAQINNATGVAGVNPHAKIMNINLWNGNEIDSYAALAAIDFATYNWARVLNLSRWGYCYDCTENPDPALYEALKNFPGLVAAAAGNDTMEHIWTKYMTPADFGNDTALWSWLTNILSVAATNNLDQIAEFSDFWPYISIAAPGEMIASTVPTNQYAYMDGTSMATPFVAGAISLLRSFRPELSYLEIKNVLMSKSDTLASLSGKVIGGKRLNIYNGLLALFLRINSLKAYPNSDKITNINSWTYISWSSVYIEWTPSAPASSMNLHHMEVVYSGTLLESTGTLLTGKTVVLSGDGTYICNIFTTLSGSDTSGNKLSTTFYVDNTKPTTTTLTSVSPLRNGTLSRAPASDAGVGMTAWYYLYAIYLSGADIPLLTGKTSATWYSLQGVWTPVTINVNLTGNGNYLMTLASCDAASNCASADTGAFTINKPLAFAFTAQTDKELSTSYNSNEITLSWLITWATIIIQWWSYSINGWTGQTETGIVYNGDKITISLTSSSANSSTTSATLNIGGLTWNFSVTTKAAPSWWGGGWWGGGWITPKICTLEYLMCSWTSATGGVYIRKNIMSCEWGDLWMKCTLTWTVVKTWINSGIIYYTLSPIFSPELHQAYSYAREIGITTVPSIEKANMTGTLIRVHLAKMISNFAINVLDKKPNTWMHCIFEDMQHETQEMQIYAKLACQLWLMWLANDGMPNTNFHPELEVTRAQFGTVLSRALRGDKYNDITAENYFTEHLAALHNVGIMKNINDPLNLEIRWRVMLMLMRAAE